VNITVFGATGRTGVPLVRRALDRGHSVVAFARSPGKLPIENPDLTIVEGDVYTGGGVGNAVEGADAVVSVLGQTDDGPDDLLAVAGERIVAAMDEHGVTRFVTLVGAGVREEGESVSITGRAMGLLLKLVAAEVLADAREHVDRLRRTDLAWTVVRAPRLTDGTGEGAYRAGDIALGFESIVRSDVARFMVDAVEDDQYVREMPKVGPA
jgi:putative NADH-flavin reductase